MKIFFIILLLGSAFFGGKTLFVAAYSEEPTPVSFSDLKADVNVKKGRPWSAPNYDKINESLPYNKEAFLIPSWIQERVAFWIDIYTKFNTEQGLLHDSKYVHLVYEVVDFSEITNRTDLSESQKRRKKRKLVKSLKKEIKARLGRLKRVKSPEHLTGEDLRYWHLFQKIKGKNRFIEAGHRRRLRFQLGQKDRFLKGIYFSGRYIKKMEEIFKESGLPVELTRLPFVESSFNVKARSKVGASGIWQFMRSTGKRYLKISPVVDERNDPLRATQAAARLLRYNYEMLKTWPLAITAYNHGPSGVRRMLKKHKASGLKDLIDIRKRRFGFASANFYASFLAAVYVEKNAEKYFKNVLWDKAHAAEKVVLTKNINKKTLLKWYDGDLSLAKESNLHLSRMFWKGWFALKKNRFVWIPSEKRELAMSDLKTIKHQMASLKGVKTYRIAKGETLSEIANQFGVSLRILKDLNGISNPRRIRAGQKIKIPSL